MHPSPTTAEVFPVYDDLVDRLLVAVHPDDVVRHVLAVCAGYAYSDEATVATMMTRLGLAHNRCVMVREDVDAMFICSTAFVVQSDDGRVVIVCYRGTEPANLINWLTDVDVDPALVRYDLNPARGGQDYRVHAGFYRNVRATRYAVVEILQRALAGKSVLGDDDNVARMEKLFVTGHSLGAAMAALMTVMVRAEDIYAPLAERLAATYTYGQPMLGTPAFAAACERANLDGTAAPLHELLFRYVYADDLVPQLPPRESGAFAHFGREFRADRLDGGIGPGNWTPHPPTTQTGVFGIGEGFSALLTRQVPLLRRYLHSHQSIVDHGPQNYVAALTPPDRRSEFGD